MGRVALIGDNSTTYIKVLLRIWNDNNCAVLIDSNLPVYSAVNMMQEAKVEFCYIDRKYYDDYYECLHGNITLIPYDSDISAQLLPLECYNNFREKYSQDEAIVIYSSGTTGKSKGIILSHFAINTNADAIVDYMNICEKDCMYIVKSLAYSSTITGELLVALKMNIPILISPVIVPPRYIFNNITKYKVTVIGVNPLLLAMYCDEYINGRYDISSLKKIYVSGSVLNDNVYKVAHTIFQNKEIYNVYGLSEAGPRVTAQRHDCCKSNSVGKAISGVEIAIVDESGNIVAKGERGIIHVKTPSRFSGYVTGSEKHLSLYHGWLNTGDIGYKDKFGELHIVGRIDDVIICDSHKVYPGDVEDLILEDSSIVDCAVSRCTFNGAETIGCLYVSETDCTMNIIQRLKTSLLHYEIPKKFMRVEKIPRNSRGKVDRQRVSNTLSEQV